MCKYIITLILISLTDYYLTATDYEMYSCDQNSRYFNILYDFNDNIQYRGNEPEYLRWEDGILLSYGGFV